MRSLFLKIFLWFWSSVVLVSLTTALIAAITQSNFQSGAWQNQAFLDIEAAKETLRGPSKEAPVCIPS